MKGKNQGEETPERWRMWVTKDFTETVNWGSVYYYIIDSVKNVGRCLFFFCEFLSKTGIFQSLSPCPWYIFPSTLLGNPSLSPQHKKQEKTGNATITTYIVVSMGKYIQTFKHQPSLQTFQLRSVWVGKYEHRLFRVHRGNLWLPNLQDIGHLLYDTLFGQHQRRCKWPVIAFSKLYDKSFLFFTVKVN